MEIIKEVQVETLAVVQIQCDKCGVLHHVEDVIDMQDFVRLRDTGGYGSAWGDGTQWSLDLCGRCAVEVLRPYARIAQLPR